MINWVLEEEEMAAAETGSCPCRSRKLLFGRRRKSRAAPRGAPSATCSEFLLPRLPEPRWAWGPRKPLPPSEWGSRGRALPPGEVTAVSTEEKNILRPKNSPTARQGGAVSEASPSSLEQKRLHVWRPRGFLEPPGEEAVPQLCWDEYALLDGVGEKVLWHRVRSQEPMATEPVATDQTRGCLWRTHRDSAASCGHSSRGQSLRFFSESGASSLAPISAVSATPSPSVGTEFSGNPE
ncbi:uncharacterized protein LOC122200728 [Panthera leo]|uniref:uncharacterized protein LOC122200728 n=1 Tax=Panthera leo TaxID=9689 RepID=UPI001C6A5A3E|nr:uncharacterized protein LOC122200728 [Panthera leo]